ncbi:MAG: NAD(P)-dependent oxidoreductase [Chitinophagaceae bacterium]|jgi:3-hydroxyisobutyrate dehydrogenase
MQVVSFLGTGLLGGGFVHRMLQKGVRVNIWNRTRSKADKLRLEGAIVFDDPASAIRGTELIHLALRDDASVDDVLSLADLQAGQTVIDHTTTSREGALRRTAYWAGRGVTYQHAPVFMGPANAREGSGLMLISGDRTIVDRWSAYLSGLTGRLVDLGDETGKAAAIKLAGNTFLVCFTFGLRETMGVAKSLDLGHEDLVQLFKLWNPASMVESRLDRMSKADGGQPSWELSMARKDTGLFMEAAQHAGVELTLLPAIAEVMDLWIGMGFGQHDWTIVGKDFR